MIVNLILNAISFFSGIINQNLAFFLTPIHTLLDFVTDTFTDLLSLEAFDLAWGWVHWLVPQDVWALLIVILTLEVGMLGLAFVFGCLRFIKVYIPVA